ncbi:hypothetical protein OIO90_001933 [Microbotryomycetes sp. JL221]|nr:hypothetical protein OIO90_001933 [Microbotryomycetes sp. JL221]
MKHLSLHAIVDAAGVVKISWADLDGNALSTLIDRSDLGCSLQLSTDLGCPASASRIDSAPRVPGVLEITTPSFPSNKLCDAHTVHAATSSPGHCRCHAIANDFPEFDGDYSLDDLWTWAENHVSVKDTDCDIHQPQQRGFKAGHLYKVWSDEQHALSPYFSSPIMFPSFNADRRHDHETIAGFDSAYLYANGADTVTCFNLHVEDVGAPSINTNLHGNGAKLWIVVSPKDKTKLESALELYPKIARLYRTEKHEKSCYQRWARTISYSNDTGTDHLAESDMRA